MASERKPVSIRDVARACGVSPTTVSLILNKGDKRISEATRQKVRAAIERLGYRPNRLAQGLQQRRSHILAILVPALDHTFADVYFGELISGIYDEASIAGYKIMLEAASPAFIRQKRYLELFDRCFIDGMLFMGSHEGHTFTRELGTPDRPLILVNNVLDDLDAVVCDYELAGRLAAEHLLSLGHRQIAMITGAREVPTAQLLRRSFAATLAEAGVSLPAHRLADGLYTEEGGARAMRTILQHSPEVTAVFGGNDKMAIGAMQMLLSSGRKVPEDISVIGCDDIRQASYVTPALTTIRTPLYDLGRRACKRMLELIRQERQKCREILPVELVIRQSTAPPPSRKGVHR